MLVYCTWSKKEELDHISSWMVYALRYSLHHLNDSTEKEIAKQDIWTNGLKVAMKNILRLKTWTDAESAPVDVNSQLLKKLSAEELENFKEDLKEKKESKQKRQEIAEKMRIERESA